MFNDFYLFTFKNMNSTLSSAVFELRMHGVQYATMLSLRGVHVFILLQCPVHAINISYFMSFV